MGGLGILAKGGSRYRKSESGREQIDVKCRGGTKSIPGELEFVRIAVDQIPPMASELIPIVGVFWTGWKLKFEVWMATGFTGTSE